MWFVVCYLYSFGYCKIVYVIGLSDNVLIYVWCVGMLVEWECLGLLVCDEWIICGDFFLVFGEMVVYRILVMSDWLIVVFCVFD